MNQSSLVLVTGSAGRIGRAVVNELKNRGRPVRGLDRVRTPNLDDAVVGLITDAKAVAAAMDGVGTVVHLAATPDDCEDVVGDLIPNNVAGVYRIFEAARHAGVQRLVVASSGQVNWNRRLTGPWPIRSDDPPTPRSWYAATKMFLEGAGRAFADAYGISVIAVRLGWCPRDKGQVQEIAECDWAQDVYLSPGDAGRFFACAVEAPAEVRFAIVYATSRPVKTLRYDLEPTRLLLGYEPQERWPQGSDICAV
jgi:nucleoside-diphosphate-sugar epimerase